MRLVPEGLASLPGSLIRRVRVAATAEGASPRSRRVVQTRPGRAYLAVRGVRRGEGDAVARAVERALAAVEGVDWAAVNPVLAEVAVAFADGSVDVDDLASELDAVEEACGLGDEPFPSDPAGHPADPLSIGRGVAAVAADATGIGLGVAGRVLRLPRLPIELASAVPAIDSLGPVRRVLDSSPRVDLAVVVVNALLQGLGQGPVGLAVDATHRLSVVTELAARRRAWLAAEHRLHPGPPPEPLVADETSESPRPVPPGPIELYGQGASLASLVGGGATLVTTGDPRRTADVVLAGLPRAARLGREGFATQLGRGLAARQVIPMDPRVLRRLERVDTVVLDARAMVTGQVALGELVAVGAEGSEEPLGASAAALFDPERPGDVCEEGEWQLAPLEASTAAWPAEARRRAGELAAGDGATLVLSRAGVVVGLVPTRPVLYASVAHIVAATRRAGHLLCVAGPPDAALAIGGDRVVDGGSRLTGSVRALQDEGRVVALVSARPGGALRTADCGIGVLGEEEVHPPWGADLICLRRAEVATVIDATRLARVASRRAVAVAAAGSLGASLFAVGALPGGGRRTMTAQQLSTLAALGVGTWSATPLLARFAPLDRRPVAWHALDPAAVLARLDSTSQGLSAGQAALRPAPAEEAHGASFASLVMSELSNPLTLVLGAGAALSAAVGSVVDAALIGGALGVDAAIGAAQRLRAEGAIGRLSSALPGGVAHVLRDGAEVRVSRRDLVAGDVIRLAAGDVVPADCRVLEAVGLEADESSLTGESFPVAKGSAPVTAPAPVADRRSMVYAGTAVAAGRGTAVVVATGADTEAGRGLTGMAPPPTGVESRLRALTDRTVPVVLAAGAGLTLNGLARARPPAEAVATGVSLTAAAVPEGLPFVATVAQAAAARRLARHGVLVRNPGVLEALGRADVLCFDKTGTLTEGRLQVQQVSDGVVDEQLGELGPLRRAVLATALRASPRPRAGGLPHPTDQAIVDAAATAGVGASHGEPGWQKAASIPFEPGRSYHAVLGRTRNGPLLSVKGAPEVVLPRCAIWRQGRSVDLDAGACAVADAAVERLARQGLRVLAVAERRASDLGDLDDERVDRLELLGFVGVADTTRSTAAGPLEELWAAGINVVMVTGDHPSTAEAVASDLGLLNGRRMLSGPELGKLDDAQLDEVVDQVAVFSRVTPSDKVRIVAAFQRAGRVVAMTGDGANDAQAIRLAEVGVAFGPRATSAAREAADLVMTEDDLGVLMSTIAEGRAMWASVRDALAILLGGNLGEILFTTGAALATGQSPLTARQLLAVNLLTDLAPAMAIAVQPPRPGLVDLRREGPESSLAGHLRRDLAIRAGATASGASIAWLAARVTGTAARARTVALVALVGTQLGQTLVMGRHSPLVVATAAGSAAGLVAMVQTPGLSQFFDCRPIGPLGWAIATGAAGLGTAGSVVAGMLVEGDTGERPGPSRVTGTDGSSPST